MQDGTSLKSLGDRMHLRHAKSVEKRAQYCNRRLPSVMSTSRLVQSAER